MCDCNATCKSANYPQNCVVRISATVIMYTATVLGILLATLTSTLAGPVSTVPLLGQRDVNNACTMDSHFPTEESYRQGVAQYCENHFPDGVILKSWEDLVFTYKLEDSRNNPIYWILRMQWIRGKQGVDSFNVNRDMCFEKFNTFIDDSYCMEGETKTVKGGGYSIKTDDGSSWVVETRQREGLPPTTGR
jgi:hypothetical protein